MNPSTPMPPTSPAGSDLAERPQECCSRWGQEAEEGQVRWVGLGAGAQEGPRTPWPPASFNPLEKGVHILPQPPPGLW